MSACLLSLSVMSLLLPVRTVASYLPSTLTISDCVPRFFQHRDAGSRRRYHSCIESEPWYQCRFAHRLCIVPSLPAQVPRVHVREYAAAHHR